MPGKRSAKGNRRSGKAKARRRTIGLGGSAGAFLAFGLSPLASAPPAHADVLDSILDPIINSLASIDPTLAVDATGWLASLDSALGAAARLDPATGPGGARLAAGHGPWARHPRCITTVEVS